MVVDDSAVVRGLVSRMLEEDPGVQVVASVGNGQLAVSNMSRYDVDVVILDIEMPVMDGLTALPKILEIDPSVRVIMASTLTLRNAEISIKALEAGAADYVPKPSSSREITGGGEFRRLIVEKVKTLGGTRRSRGGRGPAARLKAAPARAAARPLAPPRPSASAAGGAIKLRPAGREKPDVLVVGSSTGGPQALFSLLKGLKPDVLKLPILITQHMPATFTTILAEHITRMSGWPCSEAKDGDEIVTGHILLAPGDFHMLADTRGGRRVVTISKGPPENFCRPAVDPMLRSVAKVFGGRELVVILTGMGSDGLKGGQAVTQAGGTVIAQDEASSVVWGMPGAVATAGLCSAVLPLDELAPYITKFASRGGL